MDESFHAPVKQATRIKRLRERAPPSKRQNVPTLRVANAALRRRLRGVSWREPRAGRSVLCTRSSGRSFGSPPGFHRCGKLRTTFRCEVEFSLRFLGSARFFDGSGRFHLRLCGQGLFLLMDSCGSIGGPGSLFIKSDWFTLSLSRSHCFCCFKLAFQLCQFFRTLLQASFDPADSFFEIFSLLHIELRSRSADG